MTDKINGQISAFIDDELMDEEGELLIRRLCNDATLRQTAARYTLIGDAVRGSLDEIRADLNGSIMRAIEHEPVPVVTPEAPARSWRQLVGGGAVAAAVAVMAVLAIRPDAPNEPARVAAQSFSGVVVPDSNAPVDPLATSAAPIVLRAGNQAQLEQYVLRHNQYSKATMRQGVLVYRSVAGEEPRRDSASGNPDGATRSDRQP
jgi:negative regulator of sigma E activity